MTTEKAEFPYVKISPELLAVVGEPKEGTRLHHQDGSDEDTALWYDRISEEVGHCVSPGGVGMYVPVSRAAVHKRMKEGKLTAFFFHVVTRRIKVFGFQKVMRESPYIYVPISECKAWGAEVRQRADRAEYYEQEPRDYQGHDLIQFPKRKKKK